MKKIIKIIIVVILLFILAIIVTPFFFKDEITKYAKDEINNNINAKVDFADVGMTLFHDFPDFTFSLKGLTVRGLDNFKSDTLFAGENIRFTIDLSSVFSGNYEITKVVMEHPTINLLVLKNSQANWDITKDDKTAQVVNKDDSSSSSNKMHFILHSFEIRNANIRYDDKEANMSSVIRNLNLLLSGDLTANNANLNLHSTIDKLTYKMDGISYMKNAKIDFAAKLVTDLDSSKYIFKDNKLSINGLQLVFNGFVAMPKDIYVNLKYSAPKANFKSLMSLVPAFYMQGYEGIKAQGNVAVNGWVKGWYSDILMPAFGLNIKVKDAKFQYPDLPKSVNNIQIITRINSPSSDMDKMQIDVSKFHFNIAGNPMDISLKLRTPLSDPAINAHFKGRFNLASLSQVYPMESSMKLSGVFKTNLNIKGKQSDLDKGRYSRFKASGSMILKEFVYKDVDYPTGIVIHNAAMDFTPRFINLSAFNATYNKNTIDVSGKVYNYFAYALNDGILKARIQLSADYLNINALMADEENTNKQEEQQTVSNTESEPMKAFDVPANINFKIQCVIGRLKYDNINIKTIFGNVSMANKKVSLDKLKMELLGGNMEMNGYYNSTNIDSPSVAMILGINHFNFNKTYQALDMVKKLAPIMQYVKGDFSSLLAYRGKLDKHMNPNLKSVNAKGLLSTSAITIEGAKSIEAMADALKINELKKLSVDPVAIPYAIVDGKLIVKPFDAKVNGMPIKVSGTTYLNQEIEYNVNMKIPRQKLGNTANTAINTLIKQANAAGASISMSDNIDVDILLTGTTSKPKVALDFKQSKSAVEDAITDEINKQTEQLKKQAADEAERLKQEMQKKAQEEIDKQKKELERKKKEEEAKLKKKLEEEAKNKLKGWF